LANGDGDGLLVRFQDASALDGLDSNDFRDSGRYRPAKDFLD
jgi:hypothetical protein